MRRLLLAEDDDEIRSMLRDLLTRVGYDVVTCADGREALAHLRGTPEAFSLILLDWLMPVVSGAEVVEQITRHPEHGRTPIVVLTAYDRVVAGREVAAVLLKPVRPRTLVEVVDRLSGMPPRDLGDVSGQIRADRGGRITARTIALRPTRH